MILWYEIALGFFIGNLLTLLLILIIYYLWGRLDEL